MSGAIRTMAGQMANANVARRASGLGASENRASGMCTDAWYVAGTTAHVVTTAIAPIPVFADTKLHARRPKEASQ
jgi:hypothetical protein